QDAVLAFDAEAVLVDELFHPADESVLRLLPEESERREPVMGPLLDAIGQLSTEDVGDVRGAVSLVRPRDARENLLGEHRRVRHRVDLSVADVARPALLAPPGLAELPDQAAVA